MEDIDKKIEEFINNMRHIEVSEDCDDIVLEELSKWLSGYKTISHLDESDKEELTNTIISIMNSKWLSYENKLLVVREITCWILAEIFE